MAKAVVIPYSPHSGQLQLHNDTHRFKTISCGRRWGKTVFAVNEIIKRAVEVQGQYWYISPTYRQSKMIAWEMFKQFAVEELRTKLNESELSIEFKNGSLIRLMGADNPDSLRGVGLNGCVLDEFADIKRTVWSTIVRPMLSDKKGWSIFLGTPKGKINHLYEHFIRDPERADLEYRTIDNQKIEPDTDFKSFIFKTVDSPYIDPVEVDKARLELAPQYFRQEYEASFENYTGIIYKEFDPTKHITRIERGFIKDWWRVFVGLDTGRHTAVSFMAINDVGTKYVFDEIYDYDGVVKDIATQIKAKLAEWGIHRQTYIIDSASQVKREYERCGISCVDSEKDVENQIQQVRNEFSKDSLFFNGDKCPMHIVEHKGYVWNEKAKKPEPVKENDHSCNSLQYILSTYMATKSIDYKAVKAEKQTIQWLNQKSNKSNSSILRNS